MGRTRIVPFESWESPKKIEKRYIRLADSQILHPALMSLNHVAFRIYVYMRREAGGRKSFTFPFSKYKDICSKDAFQSAKRELIEKGFIKEIENNKHRQKANVYEFSADWINYNKSP